MQWILQDYEDTSKLAEILARVDIPYSMHKVVPFVGDLSPKPEIDDPDRVVMFGSYSLRHYARDHDLRPGVFELRPFLYEKPWKPYLLNGGARTFTVRELGVLALEGEDLWFVRPVDDSKEIAGTVMTSDELTEAMNLVNNLLPGEWVKGSLRPDTLMMISEPQTIQKEWRNWIVEDRLVTSSLYKMGSRVLYREEIDDDAREFVEWMIALNPNYAQAYVLDVCRTDEGLRIIETNCMNAAGFYAADLFKLIEAIEGME